MTRLLWVLALLGPVAAMAQDTGAEPAEVQEDGQVTGIVFLRGTGRPLVSATVRVGDTVTTTDRLGRFFVTLPPGRYPVTVEGPDRVEKPTQSVIVAAGESAEILVTWADDLQVLPAQVESPPADAGTATEEIEGPAGSLTGRIVSSEDGSPVAGARIYVRGRTSEAVTGPDGAFRLELPEGRWELSVIASAYAAQRVPDVAVVSEQTTTVDVDLVPAGLALEDFTFRVPKITGGTAELLDERKTGSAVADIIGAEQMSRAGDSSAASALRRVTGLTLVGGRFIFVRGLGERYSQTLLNGGQIPSPEPERRVIPLDLFPASILDSVVIQKTFSPDMPAEFGGGVVQLRTRAFPTEPVVDIALTGGFRWRTTGRTAFTYDGGPTDWLGVDGGFRGLSSDVKAATDAEPLKEEGRFSDLGYSAGELQELGREFSNIWNVDTQQAPPDWGAQLTVGNGFDVGGGTLGALLAVNYTNKWTTEQFTSTLYDAQQDEVVIDTSYDFQRTRREYGLSGLLSLGWKKGDEQKIQSSTMILRSTDDEARQFEGILPDESKNIRVSRLRWIERMLLVEQLLGEHALAPGDHPVRLSWRYGYAQAFRFEPDRRSTRYDDEGPDLGYRLSPRDGDSNSRFFSQNDDRNHDAALDVEVPIAFAVKDTERVAKVKFGGWFVQKDRVVDTRRYSFLNRGDKRADILAEDAETIFRPWRIGPNGFQIKEVTQATDNYLASQTLGAGYAMATVPATPWLDVMAGARVEYSDQEVTTFELFNPDGVPLVSKLKTLDVLPAATFSFAPRDDMKVRLGYGRTLSRPEFRELSPAVFQDVVGGRPQFGNPDLVRATIENVDLRWEWFLERGDVVSVSAFSKFFQRPIEQIVIIGADEALTYANAQSAIDVGGELEFRKNLGFMSDKVRDMYLAANASFIYSRISLDPEAGGVQTNTERPLQGQSPWVVNAQLGYDSPDTGINAALLYNAVGPRIVQVGSFGLPDTVELPFHSLDLVLGARLPKGFHVRYRFKNILDQKVRRALTTGQPIAFRQPGWTMDLRLGWRY